MRTTPIHKIKLLFESGQINKKILDELRTDKRKGIKQIIEIYDKKKAKERQLKNEFLQKKAFDFHFLGNADGIIAGVDEAGRGPLAGPVVAAAVILPKEFTYIGLNDSKQLTEMERQTLFHVITESAISYFVSVSPASEIDRINIFEATKQVMKTALLNLKQVPDIALVDAVKLENTTFPTKSIIKGDEKSLSIAAASILAKVKRDQIMNEMDQQFPLYDFRNNKGYGTQKHLFALKNHGPTPQHRKSFSPVQHALKNEVEEV